MVGFIKGVLGGKLKANTEPVPKSEPAPKPSRQRAQAFYLDASDAKTLGDLDYMQTARQIRRSFPKTLTGEEQRTVLEVSSLQRAQQQREQLAALQQQSAKVTPSTPSISPSTISGWAAPRVDSPPLLGDPKARRRDDASLDPFRAMARDLPKPNFRRA